MGEQVRVESFEALKRLRAGLCKLADSVGAGMDETDAELGRTSDWLKHGQSTYWKRECEKRTELVIRAKTTLTGKRFQPGYMGNKPSCIEEEKALALAERRLEEAAQKLANVRRWTRKLDVEILSYRALASGLNEIRSSEVPKAIALLDGMLEALDKYAGTRTLDTQGATAAAGHPAEVSEYVRLRSRTPSVAARGLLAAAKPKESEPEGGESASILAGKIPRIAGPRVPVAGEDKFVVARGAARRSRVYLERLADVAPNDSGWFLGNADDPASDEYDAIRVVDAIAIRPEIEPLLELPPGTLIVIDGQSLNAILDRENQSIEPLAYHGPELPGQGR